VKQLGRAHILPAARRHIQPWSAELRLSADGQWLFASDRRAATLSALRIDAQTGAPTLADCIDTEPLPRSFALSPDGRHAFVASQETGRLSVYGFDPREGRLHLLSQLACGNNPACSPTWVEAITLPG
jgi:6-phosphogluconolactonase